MRAQHIHSVAWQGAAASLTPASPMLQAQSSAYNHPFIMPQTDEATVIDLTDGTHEAEGVRRSCVTLLLLRLCIADTSRGCHSDAAEYRQMFAEGHPLVFEGTLGSF